MHDDLLERDVEFDVDFDFSCKYKVVLFNDDFTTMDFVVELLLKVFGKSREESYEIMLSVHNNGTGIAGIYSYEIAKTKLSLGRDMARKASFPLRLEMEEC